MQWLRIHNVNGKDYYQIVHDYKKGSEFLLGTEKYIEISEAEAALSLDKLARLYRAEKEDYEKARAETAEAMAKKADAKSKLADLVEVISRKIRESNQKGEVETCKVFYKKITGKDWEWPEANPGVVA
jgi:hypothetical protein